MSIKVPIESTFVPNCNNGFQNMCCNPHLLLGRCGCEEFNTILNFQIDNCECRCIDKIELVLCVKEVRLNCCSREFLFRIREITGGSNNWFTNWGNDCCCNSCGCNFCVTPCDECSFVKFDLTDLLRHSIKGGCNCINLNLCPLSEGLVIFNKPHCIRDGYVKVRFGKRMRCCC